MCPSSSVAKALRQEVDDRMWRVMDGVRVGDLVHRFTTDASARAFARSVGRRGKTVLVLNTYMNVVAVYGDPLPGRERG